MADEVVRVGDRMSFSTELIGAIRESEHVVYAVVRQIDRNEDGSVKIIVGRDPDDHSVPPILGMLDIGGRVP